MNYSGFSRTFQGNGTTEDAAPRRYWYYLSRMRRLAPLLAATFALSGCAAFEARHADGATEFYAGTRENIAQLRDPDPEDRALRRLMYVVDLPFSAVVDTFLIPFDWMRRKSDQPD